MVDESGSHLAIHLLFERKLVNFIDIFAGGNWTVLKDTGERLFVCGLNNYAQLGFAPRQEEHSVENGTMSQDTGDYNIFRPKHVKTFNSNSKWTHIAGVVHLALRNEKGWRFKLFRPYNF